MSSSPAPHEGEPLCEGDTKVIYDVLPHPLQEDIFARVRDEVQWQRMSHQGGEVPRLVAVQGDIDADGGVPIYRHPADSSPPLAAFTPTVAAIRQVVAQRLGHPVNHVLIQLYRDGADYISEHSDKTLDIARDSFIANVSLGAARTMVLRTKRQQGQKGGGSDDTPPPSGNNDGPRRQTQRARLPHNSLFQMGLRTNMRWLHGIRQDRRAERDKTADELAYGGERISLTFRRIATFLNRQDSSYSSPTSSPSEAPRSSSSGDEKEPVLIWGQGATAKTRASARPVINGQTSEAVAMLRAFGRENQASDFDWADAYGAGFDVLHISVAPRLFLSPDPLANLRVQLLLADRGVGYARGSLTGVGDPGDGGPGYDPPIRFVDVDEARTTVHGGDAIMRYIDRAYSARTPLEEAPRAEEDEDATTTTEDATTITRAHQHAIFQEASDLLAKYRAASSSSHDRDDRVAALGRAELAAWAARAREADFIAGPAISLADFAFWPVLHAMVTASGWFGIVGLFPDDKDGDQGAAAAALQMYYERVKARDSVRRVLAHACDDR